MKRLQNFYLYSYRLTGFIFLLGLISSILWYGFSMLFFSTSASWSVPLILSPDQEKVITHLEHMLNLEHQLAKDKTELKTAKEALLNKVALLKKSYALRLRFKQSMTAQAKQYSKKKSKSSWIYLGKKAKFKRAQQISFPN